MFGINWRVNAEAHINRDILSAGNVDQNQDLSAERSLGFWCFPMAASIGRRVSRHSDFNGLSDVLEASGLG